MKHLDNQEGSAALKLVLILMALILTHFAKGQTPSAACTDSAAQQVLVGSCATGLTISDATVNDPVASSCGVPTYDGWLWFDATSSKTSVCFYNTSNRNAAIYLYTGNPGSLTEVACENSGGPNRNEVLVMNTVPGTRYHVRIARVGNGNPVLTGDVCILNTPANDDCASATPLTVGAACSSVSGTTRGASQSANAILCNGVTGKSDDDVWYSFVAPASTDAVISLTGASAGFNPVLDLRSGSCNGSSIACSDVSASNGNETITATGLTPGQTYFVRVYGFDYASVTASGTFQICVADNCAAIQDFTVTGGGSYCQGGAGLPVGLSGSEASCMYQLKLNGGNVGSPVQGTGGTISFGVQAAAGSYTVEAAPSGNPGCSAMMSGVKDILVSASMPYAYIGNVTASVANACPGTAFTATVQPVSGATEYVWSLPAGSVINGTMLTSTQTTVTSASTTVNMIAGTPYGAGYYIFVYAQNGCGRTFNTKATWVQGTLSTPAIPSGNKTICTSASPANTEKYSIPPVAGADAYSWSIITTSGTPAQIIGSDSGAAAEVYYPAGFLSGTLSVAARFHCGYQGGARKVTISTSPAVTGAMTGADQLCPGTSSAFSIALVDGAASYAWTLPAGATMLSEGMSSVKDSAFILFPSGYTSGTVCVTPYSQCGQAGVVRCKSVYSSLPGTPASIKGPITGACNATLDYSVPLGLPRADQYQWSLDQAVLPLVTGTTASISFVSGGTVCVRAVNSGCAAPDNMGPQRCISVSSRPAPLGAISGPATVCPGAIYDYSVPASSGLTYQWTVPTGCTITANNGNAISVQWNTAGSGIVNVTASNGCSNSNTSVLTVNTYACRLSGTADEAGRMDWTAYPNPAQDRLTISLNGTAAETYTIRLIDLAGRTARQAVTTQPAGRQDVQLDVTDLSRGIYLLQVQSPSVPAHSMKVLLK